MKPSTPRTWLLAVGAAMVLGAVFVWWFLPGPQPLPADWHDVLALDTPAGDASVHGPWDHEFTVGTPAPPQAPPAKSKEDLQIAQLRAQLENANTVPGEAVVSFGSRSALEAFKLQAAGSGGSGIKLVGDVSRLNSARVRFDSLESLRDALAAAGISPQKDGAFPGVEGNLRMEIPPAPPQPDTANQGGTSPFGKDMFRALNAEGDRSHWGDRVTVAVVDTGVLAHPTLDSSRVTHLDLVQDGQPFHSHGTSVASLIAGQNPQAPGLAPGVNILDVRIAGADGASSGADLAEGILAAVDHGAGVINISMGGYGESALLKQAAEYAFQRGVVVVAAAGNEAYNQLSVPAAYQTVVSVGSVDSNGQQAYFSNSGQGLDLVAPGVGLVTAWDTDKIAKVSGTSQSAALVSAAAAAYLGWGVAPANVAARIKSDALPTGGPVNQFGAGILRVKR